MGAVQKPEIEITRENRPAVAKTLAVRHAALSARTIVAAWAPCPSVAP
jgi:hypothetical protein